MVHLRQQQITDQRAPAGGSDENVGWITYAEDVEERGDQRDSMTGDHWR